MRVPRPLLIVALAAFGTACASGEKPPAEAARPNPPTTVAAPPAEPSTPVQPVDTARPAPPPPKSVPSPAPSVAAKPKPKPKPAPTPTPAVAAESAGPQEAAAPVVDPYHPAARDTLDMDTYQGWKQYELNCSRCHGEYAVGTSFAPALAVSLKEGGTIPTREDFITTVCAGRPDKGMPAWCALGLEMDKIQNIYLYVKGRADGKFAVGRPALRQ